MCGPQETAIGEQLIVLNQQTGEQDNVVITGKDGAMQVLRVATGVDFIVSASPAVSATSRPHFTAVDDVTMENKERLLVIYKMFPARAA